MTLHYYNFESLILLIVSRKKSLSVRFPELVLKYASRRKASSLDRWAS